MARLQEHYQNELRGKLQAQLGLKNVMEVPRISKITLNMGVGEAVADKKVLENAVNDMTMIAGQKPQRTLARKVGRVVQDSRWLSNRDESNAAP